MGSPLWLNADEVDGAISINSLPEVKHWVENLPGLGRETTSFWLQTATGKFYPDFVCQLQGGRSLVSNIKTQRTGQTMIIGNNATWANYGRNEAAANAFSPCPTGRNSQK